MTLLSFSEFESVYQQTVREVYAYWTPEMQDEIAAHNYGWSRGLSQFDVYLERSVTRYYRAYLALKNAANPERICDVGGFWGVFPLTLKRLGFDVTMTEALQYYSDSFQPLFAFLEAQELSVVDYDPFEADEPLPGRYDAIFIMAVLEHYPHSLRRFMGNVLCGLKPDGVLYIEVPNMAYLPRRLQLLRGHNPLPPIQHIFESQIPFTGHHHEYTMRELKDLAALCGLDAVTEDYYNYTISEKWSLRPYSIHFNRLMHRFYPDTREVLAVACKRRVG